MSETSQTISNDKAAGQTVPRGMAIAANSAMAALIDEFGLRMATTAIIAAASAANHKAGEEQAFLSSLDLAKVFSLYLSEPQAEQGKSKEIGNG